jgi:hypothetical protein
MSRRNCQLRTEWVAVVLDGRERRLFPASLFAAQRLRLCAGTRSNPATKTTTRIFVGVEHDPLRKTRF